MLEIVLLSEIAEEFNLQPWGLLSDYSSNFLHRFGLFHRAQQGAQLLKISDDLNFLEKPLAHGAELLIQIHCNGLE